MAKDEVLAIIKKYPGIRQNDISTHIGIHNSTVSKQANKLRRDKLVYLVYDKKTTVWYPGSQV
jgi:Mn-dependent DtxR family transcriptional regulator